MEKDNIRNNDVHSMLNNFIDRKDAHSFTYIIMGKPGPTGKSHTCCWLKRKGFNAVEISESIGGVVCYDDNDHFIVDNYSGIVTIILNESLEQHEPISFEFKTRLSAIDFIEDLAEIIDVYGAVYVNDAMDLLGEVVSYENSKMGWTCIDEACISRVISGRGKFIVTLPKPIKLN